MNAERAHAAWRNFGRGHERGYERRVLRGGTGDGQWTWTDMQRARRRQHTFWRKLCGQEVEKLRLSRPRVIVKRKAPSRGVDQIFARSLWIVNAVRPPHPRHASEFWRMGGYYDHLDLP